MLFGNSGFPARANRQTVTEDGERMKVLSEQRRSSIRKKLVPVMGDDDAHAMIEALPSEGDRIVTEDFLEAKLAAFGEKMEEKFATKDFLRAELSERMEKQTSAMYRAIFISMPIGLGASGALATVITKFVGAG